MVTSGGRRCRRWSSHQDPAASVIERNGNVLDGRNAHAWMSFEAKGEDRDDDEEDGQTGNDLEKPKTTIDDAVV